MSDIEDIKTVAALANVRLAQAALDRSMARPVHLPGIVALYGPSGWGKSTAAAYCANKTQAYYIACKSAWSRKAFLGAILKQMGIAPGASLADMLDRIAEQLALSRRPLIIDEFDYMVQRHDVELVRDIYESSLSAILMIGEEQVTSQAQNVERFYSRIMHWVQAEPVNLDDAGLLAKLYAPSSRSRRI